MGGKGSGGARVGAGRKSKEDQARWLGGNAGKRGAGKKPLKPETAVELIAAPFDLPDDQREVWEALAPHACEARTLVPGTSAAFRDLCEAICVKARMYEEIVRDGFTVGKAITDDDGNIVAQEKRAHPLLTHHRGLMQRVEAGMLRFRLSPMGKELAPKDEPQDEWAEFDGPRLVKPA